MFASLKELPHNSQVTRNRVKAGQSSEKAEQSEGKPVSRSDPNTGAETAVSPREVYQLRLQHARSGRRWRISSRTGETEEEM